MRVFRGPRKVFNTSDGLFGDALNGWSSGHHQHLQRYQSLPRQRAQDHREVEARRDCCRAVAMPMGFPTISIAESFRIRPRVLRNLDGNG